MVKSVPKRGIENRNECFFRGGFWRPDWPGLADGDGGWRVGGVMHGVMIEQVCGRRQEGNGRLKIAA